MTEDRTNSIKEKLAGKSVEFTDVNGTLNLVINKDQMLEVASILKNDLSFDSLVDAIGVDRFQKVNRFEIIYNACSIANKDRIFFRAKLDTKNPEVESLTSVWPSANWYEREAYDMTGIKFKNHPDMRRMYMPEDYEYYPLRKDFPLMGIPGSIPLPNK